MKIISTLFLIFVIVLSGCSRNETPKQKNIASPLYPEKAQTHILELYKVQISEYDFNLSSFGNPLKINISLLENGEEIKSVILSGKRGERTLKEPVQWVVNFAPTNNYQLILKEISIVADAAIWLIPATPKIGYWPIGSNNGAISFGKESILYFRDKTAK